MFSLILEHDGLLNVLLLAVHRILLSNSISQILNANLSFSFLSSHPWCSYDTEREPLFKQVMSKIRPRSFIYIPRQCIFCAVTCLMIRMRVAAAIKQKQMLIINQSRMTARRIINHIVFRSSFSFAMLRSVILLMIICLTSVLLKAINRPHHLQTSTTSRPTTTSTTPSTTTASTTTTTDPDYEEEDYDYDSDEDDEDNEFRHPPSRHPDVMRSLKKNPDH